MNEAAELGELGASLGDEELLGYLDDAWDLAGEDDGDDDDEMDSLLGEDAELLGARPRRRGGKRVRRVKLRRFRKVDVPIPATVIAAAGTATIDIEPQKIFRCERLIVDAATAANLVLTGITVEGTNQWPLAGEVPLATYTEVTVGSALRLDTCRVGGKIQLTVRNDDAGSKTVRGRLYGTIAIR